MSYIPDARSDEFYNDKYLNHDDKEYIKGFDFCVENAVSTFFDNVGDFDDEYLSHILNQEVPAFMQEEKELYIGSSVETLTIKTYLDLFKANLLEVIEGERNMMITSMIDHMDDNEYERIKEAVDKENYEKGEE